jgi:hydroxyacylglutathione hydrolase
MLHDTTIPVTQFQQNCSIVWCDEGKIAAIIDPGGDIDKLLAAIKKTDAQLEQACYLFNSMLRRFYAG